jgi:hypothetical protein
VEPFTGSLDEICLDLATSGDVMALIAGRRLKFSPGLNLEKMAP